MPVLRLGEVPAARIPWAHPPGGGVNLDLTRRHCLKCAHCSINFGERGWSEETPSEPATFQCLKGHWELTRANGGKQALSDALETAATCKDYAEEKPR